MADKKKSVAPKKTKKPAKKKAVKKAVPKKRGKGRPTKYKEEYVEQAKKLCKKGMTDKELADFFGVCEDTINEWKLKYPDFSVSVKVGKDYFNSGLVENSLLQLALGREYEEVTQEMKERGGKVVEKHIKKTKKLIPPNAAACIFWTKNRDPDRWKDKQEIDNKHSGSIESKLDPSQLKDAIKEVIADDDC